MTPLTSITGLTAETAELLSATGVHSAAHLAGQDPASLHSLLEVLAWQRGRTSLTPPRHHLEQWIATARLLTPPEEVEAARMEGIPEAVTAPPDTKAWIPPQWACPSTMMCSTPNLRTPNSSAALVP